MRRRTRNQDGKTKQQIFEFVHQLRLIVSNVRLFGANYPRIKPMFRGAFSSLQTILQQQNKIIILLIDNDLIINGKSVSDEDAKHCSLLIEILKQKGIGYISFQVGIKRKELDDFILELASSSDVLSKKTSTISFGPLELQEEERDLIHYELSPLSRQQIDREEQIFGHLNQLPDEQRLLLKEMYFSLQRTSSCDLQAVQKTIASFVNCFSQNLNPLAMLATLKSGNEYTFTHVVNVCILTLAQAEFLGFTGKHLYEIGIVAALHDMGKIFIPKEIIDKPGRLDSREKKIIETHATKGAHYISNLKNIPKLATLVAMEHHIYYDGSGYPNLGKNWKTHIVSQMITIADVFDAMRSKRLYQEARPEKYIFDVLREGRGKVYNPFLVDNFLRILNVKG
jgi:HD-GYP domain-containing protein (c-di-GMP phosphodiesterase class II)